MKKILIIVFALFFVPRTCFAMLKLSEFRALYPQYNDMTDFEVTQKMHDTQYADMPYEQFATIFGGPTQELERKSVMLNGSEYSFRLYKNKKLKFSFFYPQSLKIEEEKGENDRLLHVIFLDNGYPLIVFVVKKISSQQERLFESIYNSHMSDFELGSRMYTNENISDLTHTRVTILNNRGFETSYCYRVEHFSEVKYLFLHKVETLKDDKRYKLEIKTPLYSTKAEAKFAHTRMEGLITEILHSLMID